MKGFKVISQVISLKYTEVPTCQSPGFSVKIYFQERAYHMHGFMLFIRIKWVCRDFFCPLLFLIEPTELHLLIESFSH